MTNTGDYVNLYERLLSPAVEKNNIMRIMSLAAGKTKKEKRENG